MNCEQARMLIAEELAGALSKSDAAEIRGHLDVCTSCRSEAAAVHGLWTRLGDLAEPDPSPFLATRFHAALDAYQQGQRHAQARGFWRWWPATPAWQAAVALGCLAIGLFTGSVITTGKRGGSEDIAELRKEMSGMRQLVTLSLLQQQSASERLRGVSWSYRAEPSDVQVLSALLRTVNEDASPDVRLAAIDALRNFSDSAVARRGLAQALPKQNSPLVQIAVIDALVDMREPAAVSPMKQLLNAPDLNDTVRERLQTALQKF